MILMPALYDFATCPSLHEVTKSRICLRTKNKILFLIFIKDTIIALNFFLFEGQNTLWESGEILLSIFPKI